MRPGILALILLTSLAAAAAEIPVSPLDVSPEPTPYYRVNPVNVVAGETSYVVSWTELYFSPDSPYGAGAYRIFDASGHPTMLATDFISRNHTFAPAGDDEFVLAEGTRWMIHPPPSPIPTVFLSWVERDGTRGPRIQLARGQSETTTGPAAATHDHALVTYYNGSPQPHLALVLRDGTIVRDWQRDAAPLAIATIGSGFLVFTTNAIIPVTSGGDEGNPITTGPFTNLKIAAHDDRIGAAWTAGDHTYAAIFRADGTIAEQLEISNGIAPSLVAWSGDRFRTLLANCVIFFGGGPVTTCGPLGLGGAYAGTTTTNVVARLIDGQIRTATGPTNSVPVAEGTIASQQVRQQVNPAADGETLVWSERPADGGFMQVVVNGQPIAPSASADQIFPRIAGPLVVWTEVNAIRAAFLDDAAHTVFNLGNGYEPDVATDGISWLVVWRSASNDHPAIYATGITRSGAITQPGGAGVAPSNAHQYRPVVASPAPGRFLVEWQESEIVTGIGPQERLVDVPVDINVTRLGDPNIVFTRNTGGYSSSNLNTIAANELACNAGHCVTTWLDEGRQLRDAALDANTGATLSTNMIAADIILSGRTSLIPSGSGFAFGWASSDVRITMLDASGTPVETRRIGGTNVADLALISKDEVIYSRPVAVIGSPRRVFLRSAPPQHRRAM